VSPSGFDEMTKNLAIATVGRGAWGNIRVATARSDPVSVFRGGVGEAQTAMGAPDVRPVIWRGGRSAEPLMTAMKCGGSPGAGEMSRVLRSVTCGGGSNWQ
jgi:hypothetical protein